MLSGPLTVGGGEALVINTGVTLYASRNPANYQVSGKPTCGTVATSGGGCKSFITVNGANASIMGTQGERRQGLSTGAATSTWSARASRGGTWPTPPRARGTKTTRGSSSPTA